MSNYKWYGRAALLALLAALIGLTVSSCARKTGQNITERNVTDREGIEVTIKGPLNRVVSTAPSNTEIIVDLGLAKKLVAIDVYSTNIEGLPDGLIQLDFMNPDAEVLVGLEPDIIIANGHNATGTGEDPFRVLREMGIPVVYIPMGQNIEDIYLDIAFVADLFGIQQQGEALIHSTREEVEKIRAATAAVEPKRSVYFEISEAPFMFTLGKGSFLHDMITVIGAINIFENDGTYVSPSAEAIIDRNPDVILTNVNYIDNPIGELKSRPGFEHINAVMNNRVYLIDMDSSSRPSARITLALRQMSRAVYPEVYDDKE
ncbi:MAG: ABC transporter substrate-binding protein [Treponema sp.]|jgi:iron complex transport system substrate-binding protein|nr:ABC transporter substrate-binding protein [Treponema sp.]